MPSTTYHLIRHAILNKRQVFAIYQGHRRELCPHALGRKGDREQALFYQFAGSSSKGLAPAGSRANWRCLPIDELTEVSAQDGDWHTAPYEGHQSCAEEVDVAVDGFNP